MATKQDYFDSAFDLLSEQGYHALKQATLCRHVGVTTGSFYHYFQNWNDFTSQLLNHWLIARTTQLVEMAQERDDAVDQLESLLQFTLALPHRAEAALRVWAMVDPDVRAVQDMVDEQRRQVVLEAMRDVYDEDEAIRRAQWGVFVLAGYQQLSAGKDLGALEWALRRILQDVIDKRAAVPENVEKAG